jgi:hypothetical protein
MASVDPSDPQTWNRYAYVRGNPLAMTDPDGQGIFADLFSALSLVADFFGVPIPPIVGWDIGEGIDVMRGETPGLGTFLGGMSLGIAGVGAAGGGISPPPGSTWGSGQIGGVAFSWENIYAAGGHHWYNVAFWKPFAGSAVYNLFKNWTSGKLPNPSANYNDALHRAWTKAVEPVQNDYLKSVGKTTLNQLSDSEAAELQQEVISAAKDNPAMQQFLQRMEKLNPGRTSSFWGTLGSGATEIGVFLVVAPQVLLNLQKCGVAQCGSSRPM